jgi:2-(1,2-epoxy-1,2-dihydrophenyl)acetyl-CoA isomerase
MDVLFDVTDGVAVAVINRPDVMNALNAGVRAGLRDAVARAQDARVLVITGAGRAFSSGQDLGDAGGLTPADMERILREEYEPLLLEIGASRVPTIAAVNGVAAGAGCNLALACDVVIAAETASFIQSFTRIGLVPDAGGTWTLPRQVGMARAMGLMLFADAVTVRDAVAMGMIYEAVPDDAFAAHWQGRAAALSRGPALALEGVKDLLRACSGNSLQQQLALEAAWQARCGVSADFAEGVAAFRARRKPDFNRS